MHPVRSAPSSSRRHIYLRVPRKIVNFKSMLSCEIFVIFGILAVPPTSGAYLGGSGEEHEAGFNGDFDVGHDFVGHESEEHTVPQYSFQYAVHDPLTGDEKNHHEERYGDFVKGYYSLKDADGSTRYVKYTADKYNGFNAEVHKLKSGFHEELPIEAASASVTKQEDFVH